MRGYFAPRSGIRRFRAKPLKRTPASLRLVSGLSRGWLFEEELEKAQERLTLARRGLKALARPWRGGESSGGDRPHASDVTIQRRYGFTVGAKPWRREKARDVGS
jgi:hypothetical protein